MRRLLRGAVRIHPQNVTPANSPHASHILYSYGVNSLHLREHCL
ncbi:hypothetical protein [Streptomyces sp. AC550_RSS872]|nr:hypothetical protein [Streptomyces sp. AC550_RSS872]